MILIIEGPDGSGKTTLANKISQQTSWPIIHRTQPKSDDEKKTMMDSYLEVISSGRNCIFDRSWYSEMVYGPIMRDTSVISYAQMFTLERKLSKRGAMLIHCTGPSDILWKRCQARGENYIVDRQTYTRIYSGFGELMYDVPHIIPVVTYEYREG